MKKKTVALAVLSLLAAGFCALGAACSKEEGKQEYGDGWTVQTVYAKAQELGFEGSLEEFIALVSGKDGKNGTDGVGIKNVTINAKGELIVELTSGDPINCGKLPTAEVAEGSQDLLYVISEDETYYTLMGRGLCADRNLIIPATYRGLPVKEIGTDAFRNDSLISSAMIPDSVETIGDSAFRDCTGLTSVTIGNSVTTICDEAFSRCTGLMSVTIPDSVETIGLGAFETCRGLTSIQVSANNAKYKDIDGNLYSKDGKTLIQYAIGKTATSFTVPDSVETIERGAFSYCTGITSVSIGNSVTTICDEAFSGCSGLTSVTIPDNVTKLGNRVFYNCTGLTSVTFEGTKEEWLAVEKVNGGWNDNFSIEKVVCTDGEIAV